MSDYPGIRVNCKRRKCKAEQRGWGQIRSARKHSDAAPYPGVVTKTGSVSVSEARPLTRVEIGPRRAYLICMAKGPKGQKRPADTNQRALAIVRIATGEDVDPTAAPRGQAGGKKGGSSRAKKLTDSQRSEIARKAALTRWGHQTDSD